MSDANKKHGQLVYGRTTGGDNHTIQVDSSGVVAVTTSALPSNTTATGTLTATAQSLTLTVPSGGSSCGIQVTGTWTGQLDFQASIDGSTFVSIYATSLISVVNATTANGEFIVPCAGQMKIRVYATSIASGTGAVVTMNASVGSSGGFITGPLPAGTNSLGTVSIGGLNLTAFDYVALTQPTTVQDVYTFKTGGSGGTTTNTVTVNYTDSSHDVMTNMTKT